VRHPAILTVLATAVVGLAACGGDESSGKKDAAPSPDRSKAAPKQILDAAAADVAKLRSYHLEGTETDKDGVGKLRGDVSGDGGLRFTLDVGKSTINLVVIERATYLKANKAFWTGQGNARGPLATTLADRWVKAPSSSADVLKGLAPKDLSYCLGIGNGTLRNAGTRTEHGRRAVVVADKGDVPGDAPGELYVAATGPALPLRVTQTGKERPGGKPDPRCDSSEPGDEASTTTASDYRFSAFDKPVRITAPPDALDLDKLQQGGNSTPA